MPLNFKVIYALWKNMQHYNYQLLRKGTSLTIHLGNCQLYFHICLGNYSCYGDCFPTKYVDLFENIFALLDRFLRFLWKKKLKTYNNEMTILEKTFHRANLFSCLTVLVNLTRQLLCNIKGMSLLWKLWKKLLCSLLKQVTTQKNV